MKIYRLVIEDYGMPSYCSGSKFVFGTLDDIQSLVSTLKEKNECLGLTSAFDKYQNGDKKVTYSVAYNLEKLLSPATILESKTMQLDNFAYEHINVWSCSYNFQAASASFERVLIRCGRRYYIAVKPTFVGLKIANTSFEDIEIGNGMWGHPGVFEYDEECKTHTARLFFIEKSFTGPAAAEEAFDVYNNKQLQLKSCFDDIVADG